MTFHVGQKVVCVDAAPCLDLGEEKQYLIDGAIYTVSAIHPTPSGISPVPGHTSQSPFMVELRECARVWDNGLYRGFGSVRFRPVQEQGMSILRAILANPKRELEVVE